MLIHSWRWFGPRDRISLGEILQAGANNIVTALHEIPAGKTWPVEAIRERKKMIEGAGLHWSVVESLPVHEDIKLKRNRCREYTENFKKTLANLGEAGIPVVCYNFMPALDWSRTDLKLRFEDGGESLNFNFVHFAAVDLFILQRPGAESDYPPEITENARNFYNSLNKVSRKVLKETFLLGFPGSGESFSLEQVMERIQSYKEVDRDTFRSHLAAFLQEVVPAAEMAGIRLAIHPDDPPWSLLGMPRAVSTLEDAEFILQAVDSPANGITLCTGSLGAAYTNDLETMASKLAHRINYAHLRNVSRDEQRNFREEYFFEGDVDMYRILGILVREDRRRLEEGDQSGIPLRPDHGARILGDLGHKNYPGYSLYGRMKSLAEIRGLETGIRRSLEENLKERKPGSPGAQGKDRTSG